MNLMTGIDDRPKNDDDVERKRPMDGCPMPWRVETLPDSARLRELEPPEELGRDRSLSHREPSRRDE